MNVPNVLTIARVAMVPVLVVMIYMPSQVVSSRTAEALATSIFVLACITDWLDGYLARTLNQTSKFGAFLDPVADKILVCASLILLVHMGRLHSVVAMIIIGREIAVSALREWMASMGKRNVVAVAMLGKVKTAAQMVAIPFLLCDLRYQGGMGTKDVGTVLIWIAAGLTLWSMIEYMRAAARELRGTGDEIKSGTPRVVGVRASSAGA